MKKILFKGACVFVLLGAAHAAIADEKEMPLPGQNAPAATASSVESAKPQPSGVAQEAPVLDIEKDIKRLLSTYGAVSFSQKKPYGAGIESVSIGFGNDGKPVVGVAVRDTKTYKQALAIVAVTPDKAGYKIAAAEIPDIETFHGKSKTLTQDALKDITGKVFSTSTKARGLVDAVTSATQYYKAVYVSYALMSSKVIDELATPPDWPRTPLSAQP